MADSKKTVVAIGKFDGVHLGHQKLLHTAAETAKKQGADSLCFVISSPGGMVLNDSQKRNEIIKSIGIDRVFEKTLTADFMNMSAEDFVKNILEESLGCVHVVVGFNFRFAKGRSADAEDLKYICNQRNIGCTVIPEVICRTNQGELTASSSNIRECLYRGDVKSASMIMGRPYILTGEVVCGNQIGRTFDFPTANIDIKRRYLLPKNGVYETRTYLDGKKYLSITNIGDNPTVNEKGNITVETNIFDFSGIIYGKEITIEFVRRIRDEIKFNSPEELKKQIQKDKEFVLLTK